jgi:hypothetical protein
MFEPRSIPELSGIASAKNLELLTYRDNPVALVQLRKQFEDDGFRGQERKITYALKRITRPLASAHLGQVRVDQVRATQERAVQVRFLQVRVLHRRLD